MELMSQDNKLYSIAEVADFFRLTREAIYHWLKVHEDFKENKEYIVQSGRQRFFTEKGVIVYRNIKDGKTRNQHISQSEHSSYSDLETMSKESLVEKVYGQAQQITQLATEIMELKEGIMALQKNPVKQLPQKSHSLINMPEPKEQLPEIKTRSYIVSLVNSYAAATETPFQEVWGIIYKDLFYRYQYNVHARAKNQKMKKLDVVEKDEMMDKLYAVALDVLRNE